MTGRLSPGFGLFVRVFPFVCLFAVSPYAAEIDFPELTGRVVDAANIMSPAGRRQLAGELAEHERKTSNQIVVVTVKSLQGRTIEEYGYQLGRHWGIGQKEKSNGVLLIVAPAERKVRIEAGYGLEDRLTDAVSKLIIEQDIVPEFRAGRMQDGIVAGARRIASVIDGGPLPGRSSGGTNSGYFRDIGNVFPTILLLAIVVLFFFIPIFTDYPKRQRCCTDQERKAKRRKAAARRAGAISGSEAAAFVQDECRYRDDHFGGYGGGFGSGGYGGGGFGSGGGFSGGGGSFGGGGASGGW